jgi:hypothetical protein
MTDLAATFLAMTLEAASLHPGKAARREADQVPRRREYFQTHIAL